MVSSCFLPCFIDYAIPPYSSSSFRCSLPYSPISYRWQPLSWHAPYFMLPFPLPHVPTCFKWVNSQFYSQYCYYCSSCLSILGRVEACSFVACLRHLTIDHASPSIRSTLKRDASNIWALFSLLSRVPNFSMSHSSIFLISFNTFSHYVSSTLLLCHKGTSVNLLHAWG